MLLLSLLFWSSLRQRDSTIILSHCDDDEDDKEDDADVDNDEGKEVSASFPPIAKRRLDPTKQLIEGKRKSRRNTVFLRRNTMFEAFSLLVLHSCS